LESLNGTIEVLAFANVYEKYKNYIRLDLPIFVHGKVSSRGAEDNKIIAEEIIPLEGYMDTKSKRVHLQLNLEVITDETLAAILELAEKYPGDCRLILHLTDNAGDTKNMRSGKYSVSSQKRFINALIKILGEENVWVEA